MKAKTKFMRKQLLCGDGDTARAHSRWLWFFWGGVRSYSYSSTRHPVSLGRPTCRCRAGSLAGAGGTSAARAISATPARAPTPTFGPVPGSNFAPPILWPARCRTDPLSKIGSIRWRARTGAAVRCGGWPTAPGASAPVTAAGTAMISPSPAETSWTVDSPGLGGAKIANRVELPPRAKKNDF